MKQKIAILHFTSPPTVGGVESTIAYQARELANLGYPVKIIAGSGTVFDERIQLLIEPRLASQHPGTLAVKKELDSGIVSPAFENLVDELTRVLQDALSDCAVCIAHNVHTLHKNLALTAAFTRIHAPPVIAWCHDLAWTNELYTAEVHEGYPWDLARTVQPFTQYVTVSTYRQHEMATLLNLPAEQITVIEPGIDPALFYRWADPMPHIESQLKLLDSDYLLLLPARITRRKNIEFALYILKALRSQTHLDYRLIVTGPPGAHNPTNSGYLSDLLHLREKLHLNDSAHFLYQLDPSPFIPDDSTIASLYQLSDAVLLPGFQEGFGIPVLEGGLAGIPVFCSEIPPFRETGQDDIHYFDPHHTPPEAIAERIHTTLTGSSISRLKQRVRKKYRWEQLIREKLVPLLEGK